MLTREDRITGILIAAVIGYALAEYVTEQAISNRKRLDAWYAQWLAPFIKHPGRREFLRESLIKEEMNVKVRGSIAAPADDCGCE